ncbi:MAG: ArsR/SmtB family transcription factor, partial [Haloglomus sp.]
MTHPRELGEPTALSPDEAFGVLGNETRIQILQTLGEADGPLSFTELRDRVGIRQGSQFNYHLDKLVGHFVRKTDDGYELRLAGRRVIYAVLSEAVTEA